MSAMEEEDRLLALVIDDEKGIRDALEGVFSDEGWRTITAKNGKEGIKAVVKDKPDLVLLDVWMTGMDGIETLQKIKELDEATPVVIMSGHGSIETAVRATKLGAFDYLEKPLSLEKLLPMLEHAGQIRRSREKQALAQGQGAFVGECAEIKQIQAQISRVAPRNAWVLITGENGTGKEVVARQIHDQSSRADNPFVAVNCAAIPEELIESELFGHTKGAFTNAVSHKKGKFEMANRGTLFLDEIGDMSLKTQAKILRILQEQCFEKVGGTETIQVDVRVVAATNKDLQEAIGLGQFREDLYYRLNVIPLHLPPLRERGEDVILLARHFLTLNAADLGEEGKELSPDVADAFRAYSWPGNVRELRNVLERLCIMTPSVTVQREDLAGTPLEKVQVVGKAVPVSTDGSTLKQAKTDFERAFILDKLEENQWNVSRTAEAIGIERSNLHRKIKAFDIDTKRLKG